MGDRGEEQLLFSLFARGEKEKDTKTVFIAYT